MSEAYLFARAVAPSPAEALATALRACGAQPAWVGEAHWIGAPAPQPLAGKPLFAWPADPLLPCFTLQSLARALQAGAGDLLVAGESRPDSSVALLLGSPAAVGRWNLPPCARLTPLSTPQTGRAEFVTAAVDGASRCLPEGAALALVGAQGIEEEVLQRAVPGAAWLLGPSGLWLAARLVEELERTRSTSALLAAYHRNGGLALLLERI